MSPDKHPWHVIGDGIVHALTRFEPHKPVPALNSSKQFDDLAALLGDRRVTAYGALQVLALGGRRMEGAEVSVHEGVPAGPEYSVAQALRHLHAMSAETDAQAATNLGQAVVGDLLGIAHPEQHTFVSIAQRKAAVRAITGMLEVSSTPLGVVDVVLENLLDIIKTPSEPALIEGIEPTANRALLLALEQATNNADEKVRGAAGLTLAKSGQLSSAEKSVVISALTKALFEEPNTRKLGRSYGEEFKFVCRNLSSRLERKEQDGVRRHVVCAVIEGCYVEIDGFRMARDFRPVATAEAVDITAPNSSVRKQWLNDIFMDMKISATPSQRILIAEPSELILINDLLAPEAQLGLG